MNIPSRRWFALLAVALGLTAGGRAAELPILAKARARLGPDAALDGVRSIRYVGTLTQPDPKDPTKTVSTKIEMIFQKPDQQLITATSAETVESTGLDSYEGWTRVQSIKEPAKWRLTLLDANQLKRFRASTWETLNYFRGGEKAGVRVEDQGTVTMDGVTCQKVAFIHAENIRFYRYFDVATGRLVVTETESGMTLRESGELTAGGILFPKTLVTTSNGPKGVVTMTVTYDKVTVNEVFAGKIFAVPSVSNR